MPLKERGNLDDIIDRWERATMPDLFWKPMDLNGRYAMSIHNASDANGFQCCLCFVHKECKHGITRRETRQESTPSIPQES